MFLVYGPVIIQPMSNISIEIVPEQSRDGMDMLYQRIKFRGVGIIHHKYTASNYQGPALPWGQLVPNSNVQIPDFTDPNTSGDLMPKSINALRQQLKRPRQLLTYIQGNQVVFQSPMTTGIADANGNVKQTTAACDAAGGPFPRRMRVYQLTGIKTAWVEYEIETYISDSQSIVVSSRWSAQSDLDENYYTVRTIRGTTVMRLDWANLLGVNSVDQFRNALMLPNPGGFKRERISVTESSDGRTLEWETVDRQQTVCVNADDITSIDGYVTTGFLVPISFKGAVGNIVDLAKSKNVGEVTSNFFNLLKSHTPEPRASAVLTIRGRPGADRNALYNFAKGLLFDRFAPLVQNGKLFIVSAFLTQRVSTDAAPEIEFRTELYMGAKQTLQVWRGPWSSLNQLQNMASDWNVAGVQFKDQTDSEFTDPNALFGNQGAVVRPIGPINGRYSSYTGNLLAAALGDDTRAPTFVPQSDLTFDQLNIK